MVKHKPNIGHIIKRHLLPDSDRTHIDSVLKKPGDPPRHERYVDNAGDEFKNRQTGYRNPGAESKISWRDVGRIANNWDGQPDHPMDFSYYHDRIDPVDEADDPRLDPGEKTAHVDCDESIQPSVFSRQKSLDRSSADRISFRNKSNEFKEKVDRF